MNLLRTIRKHVVEEGDCWNWTGAFQSKSGTVPTMRWQGKTSSVRRFVLLAGGVDLTKRLATYTCGNPLCVNPEHLTHITRRALQKRTAKVSGYANNPTRCKRVSDKARARSNIDITIATEIREADGTQRDIAARFGIKQSAVSKIKRGETWREYTNPFAGLGAR